jgi:acyl-CoA synthetase (NDP forming)
MSSAKAEEAPVTRPIDLSRLIAPRSVAVIGASPTPGSLGGKVVANLERAGFAGSIHLVTPKRSEIGGRACVASVADLPPGVDCAILAIPKAGVLEALEACGANAVGAAIVFSAGFAEDGEEGLAAQQQIAAIAHRYGMAIEGPNCLGLVNYVAGAPLTFIDTEAKRLAQPSGLAIVSQSGAMATVMASGILQRDLGLSYSISTGNEAALGTDDFVEYLLADHRTRAILMVVEQFRKPKRFLALARRAKAMGKPILLLHPGRSEAARQSAATHTGAMAGDYQVMRTQVARAGVTVVETIEELVDLAELVLRCPVPAADGAAVLAESGAYKALTLDFAASIGLNLAPLGDATSAALRAVLPAFIPPSNPLDITAQGLVDLDLYRKALTPILGDKSIGAVVLAIIITNAATARLKLEPIVATLAALKSPKPVIFAALDECDETPPELIRALREMNVPYFPSSERAYRALRHFLDMAKPLPAAPDEAAVQPPRLSPGVLTEHASKQLFAGVGLAIPPGGLACSVEEAQAIARRIGFPVVLKAQAEALPHKSDSGGVELNVSDETLAVAWARLHANVGTARPDVTLDGVLVETMSPKGVELIIGARNDAEWGPVILVGFGGVLAEAIHDVRLIPADLPHDAIVAEILQLKSAALLKGFRSITPRDVGAVARIVTRLGGLLRAAPEIAEIDINPVMVYAEGEGALALDALIYVGEASA